MIVYNIEDTTNPAKRHSDRSRIDLMQQTGGAIYGYAYN